MRQVKLSKNAIKYQKRKKLKSNSDEEPDKDINGKSNIVFFDDYNGPNDSLRPKSPFTQHFKDFPLKFLIKAKEISTTHARMYLKRKKNK